MGEAAPAEHGQLPRHPRGSLSRPDPAGKWHSTAPARGLAPAAW